MPYSDNVKNRYYKTLQAQRNDSKDLQQVIERVAHQLVCRAKGIDPQTDQPLANISAADSADRPGMLLGEVQSGKTRTYTGVMAKGFDQLYDIVVIFTKNSLALEEQTIKRMKKDFNTPIKRKKLRVCNIFQASSLNRYAVKKKIILVVKKESKSLARLIELFEKGLPFLQEKNVLVVDDEADSVTSTWKKESKQIVPGSISQQISAFRDLIRKKSVISFLQVTATPYSLYLQPDNVSGYRPIKPSFTEVLKPHDAYIGGRVYFEDSTDPNHYAWDIFKEVSKDEFSRLTKSKSKRNPSRMLHSNIMTTSCLKAFRKAFVGYLTAGSIRMLQEQSAGDVWVDDYFCAYLIHVDMGQASHDWQEKLIKKMLVDFKQPKNEALLLDEITKSYDDFAVSIAKAQQTLPSFDDVVARVKSGIEDDEITVRVVNSRKEISHLLNDDGQLELISPFNVFIGGQSLDRGITIDNLICFYYGRNPQKFQMDTVIQHARMYGARSLSDMAVTRLYTSKDIFAILEKMYFIDKQLRNDAQNPDKSVFFMARDQNGMIRPCGPDKLLASKIRIVRGKGRLLPVGFQTLPKRKLATTMKPIHRWISSRLPKGSLLAHESKKTQRHQWTETVQDILPILEQMYDAFQFHHIDYSSNLSIIKHAIEKFANQQQIRVHYVGFSNIGRMKGANLDIFQNAPADGKTTRPQARQDAEKYNMPVLILNHVKGTVEKGWKGESFYWPVLLFPGNTETHIYAEE